MSRKKIKTKSKDMIKEAVDIVKNSENDESAVAFLRDTLDDDFPDLDLGRMDLHEAIKSIGAQEDKKKATGGRKAIEDLNKSLGDFIEIQARKLEDANRKKVKKAKTTKKTVVKKAETTKKPKSKSKVKKKPAKKTARNTTKK